MASHGFLWPADTLKVTNNLMNLVKKTPEDHVTFGIYQLAKIKP